MNLTREQKDRRNEKLRLERKTIGSRARRVGKFNARANRTRKRAEALGVPYDISACYLMSMWDEQAGLCALSLLPFASWDIPLDAPQWNSWSIDRIKPALGYVRGNVRLVLFCLNSMKGTGTDEHLYTVARALLDAQHNLASDA